MNLWPLLVLGGAYTLLARPRRNPQLAFDLSGPSDRERGMELAKKFREGGPVPTTAQVREIIELLGYPYKDEYRDITEKGEGFNHLFPMYQLAAGKDLDEFWPQWYKESKQAGIFHRNRQAQEEKEAAERAEWYQRALVSPMGVRGKRSPAQEEAYRKRFMVWLDPQNFQVGLANAKRFGGKYDTENQGWDIPGIPEAREFFKTADSGWLGIKPIRIRRNPSRLDALEAKTRQLSLDAKGPSATAAAKAAYRRSFDALMDARIEAGTQPTLFDIAPRKTVQRGLPGLFG